MSPIPGCQAVTRRDRRADLNQYTAPPSMSATQMEIAFEAAVTRATARQAKRAAAIRATTK
jgi:hypothetical protein